MRGLASDENDRVLIYRSRQAITAEATTGRKPATCGHWAARNHHFEAAIQVA
jgi:hypothetical protein